MTELCGSRRHMLASGMAVGTLLLAGGTTLAGCTTSTPAPEAPDPLEPTAQRAESDVVLARAVAGKYPMLAAAAEALAADRQAHATALRAELRRARPTPVTSSSPAPASSTPPAAPVAALADQAAARAALTNAVGTAQDQAAGLVATLPGYRAALLASVAACCASHAAVLP